MMGRKCKYRDCDKILTEIDHGNRDYCPPKKDQLYKLSCKAREQKLLKKEIEKERSEKNKRILKLRTVLESLSFGNGNKCNISIDFFLNNLKEMIDVFQKEEIFGSRGDAVLYRFEEYSMFKLNISGIYQIQIAKNTKNEKQIN